MILQHYGVHVSALSNFIDPNEIDIQEFSICNCKKFNTQLEVVKKLMFGLYVGESGWEIYFNNNKDDGLALI